MDYRSAQRVADDMVVHRPLAPRTAWLLLFGAIAFTVASFLGALYWAATIDVVCRHAPAACIVTTTRPVLGVSTKTIPLDDVRTARLKSFRPKKNASLVYDVVLVSSDGKDIELADAGSIDRAAWESMREQLVAFLRDPDAPSLGFRYSAGQRTSLYMTPLLLALIAVMSWRLLQRTTITFSWADQRVQILRTRWPLGPWSRTLPLADAARVHVVEKDHMFHVALDLVGGESVALSQPFYFRKPHELTADALQTLLRRAEEQRAAALLP